MDFSEYLPFVDEDYEHLPLLESSYHEAQRAMSPRGLQNYLEGMRAISMGKSLTSV